MLAANGITAYVYPRLEPTPALSWAVRYLGCGAGVCVTASHNPAKYNGYKVYGADGCQITLEAAEKILAAIEKIDCFDGVKLADYDKALADGSIVRIGDKCLDDFVQAVYDQRVGDGAGIDALKLVYTPLNGTGLECVKSCWRSSASPCDRCARAGKAERRFPHLPLPEPRNSGGYAERSGTVRYGQAGYPAGHRPRLRPLRHRRARRQGAATA